MICQTSPFQFNRSILRSGSLSALTVATSLMIGCQSSASRDPFPLQPQGARDALGLPADQLPAPIDLSDPSTITRTTVEATIIDTNALARRQQITGPYQGEIQMIKHVLPKHGRDKTFPENPGNVPLPVGQAAQMDRVNTGVSTGFEGISQTEWSPPDPTLAVGPNHIVQTVNAAIAFFDKEGNQTFSSHLGTPGNPGFFEEVGASSNFVFDPKCFYDHKIGRFVVIGLEQIGSTESWIDIAISDDSDPNGIWYKYRTFSVIGVDGSNYWVDYPGFGFDDQAFYVTGNLFLLNGNGSGFAGQLFRIFDKAPMLNGDPITFLDLAPNNGASIQVAQMFGDAPGPVFVSQVSNTQMRIWTFDTPLTTPSLRSRIVGGFAPASSPASGAPNPGGGEISTLDGRLMNVQVRDDNLYFSHGINGPGNRSVARWYHMNLNNYLVNELATPSIVQQGEVGSDTDQHYFFPAIYSDKFNNVGMITSRSAPNEFASVQVSGRKPSDPLGTMSEPIQLAIGNNGANGRWGDYLDIAIDPNDDRTFWIVGMYQRPFGWQTWIDSFTIQEPCAADIVQDGNLNFQDISAFIVAYSAQDPIVDFNNDGNFNFLDVSLFLSLYGQGCP
ncbi:MAG: GC-type dockerin domain-anchored protein [Phycisphaerales bacterium]